VSRLHNGIARLLRLELRKPAVQIEARADLRYTFQNIDTRGGGNGAVYNATPCQMDIHSTD
jgi:hypothetical protein